MINCKKSFAYEFKGEIYTTYQDLAKAFSEDFDSCVYEVSSKGFISRFKDDRLMCGQLDLAIRSCKYSTSAATSTIYLLDKTLGIIIGDNQFNSIKDIASYMEKIYPKTDELVKLFFIDRCASNLLIPKNLDINNEEIVKYYNTIIKLEQYFETDFAYYYFIHYHLMTEERSDNFQFNDLDYYIRSILSEPSKGVSASFTLANDFEFLSRLCDFIGFDGVYRYLNCVEDNDYYYGLVNLIKDYSKFDIRPFLLKGYHIWLLENFNNYNYVSQEAKELYNKLTKLPTITQLKLLSDDELIEVGGIAKILYYDFSDLFTRNILYTPMQVHITAKELNFYLFIKLDDVLVCENYYANVFEQTSEEGNTIINSIIDEKIRICKNIATSIDEYGIKTSKMDETIELLKQKKAYYKKSLKLYYFLSVICIIFLVVFFLRFIDDALKISDIFDGVYLIFSVLGVVIALIVNIHYKIIDSKLKKKTNIYADFNHALIYLNNTKEVVIEYKFDESEDTTNQLLDFKKQQRPLDKVIGKFEELLYNEKVETNNNYYLNEAINGYEITTQTEDKKHFTASLVTSVLSMLTFNLAVFYLIQYSTKFISNIPKQLMEIISYIQNELEHWYYYAAIIPVTILIICLIRKKTGLIQTILAMYIVATVI